MQNESFSEKYLGMPSVVGQSKNGTFKYLRDRVWEKVRGWMQKLLSAAGKEVLIKSVAQAIPVFSMACFRLPRGLCETVTSIIRQFWWGSKQGKRKPAWVSWDVLTRPKNLGGLGFRDLEIFNLALLSRQAWRCLNEPNSLSARILKAVYYPDSSILDAELGQHPSQIWRAIVDGRNIMKQGIIRRIGDGRSTNVWQHNWIPRAGLMRPITSLLPDPPRLVADFIDTTSATWKEQVIRQVFVPVDAEAILKIPLCTRHVEDFWAWAEDPRGRFSVRTVYKMIFRVKMGREAWLEEAENMSNMQGELTGWSSLWRLEVLSKLKVFTWRLAHHSLPTGDVLQHRNMATTDVCGICGAQDSWRHSLLDCAMSRSIWALSNEELVQHMSMNRDGNAKSWLFSMTESIPQDELEVMIVTLWAIWSARRKVIHEGIFQTPYITHCFISSYLSDLQHMKKPVTGVSATTTPRPAHWIPPPDQHMKVNVGCSGCATWRVRCCCGDLPRHISGLSGGFGSGVQSYG